MFFGYSMPYCYLKPVILIILFSFLAVICSAQFAGGSGTEQDPWQIATAEHLENIRDYLGEEHADKHFLQTADIDLGVPPWNSGHYWQPIGHLETESFEGTYDGNHHSITGLYINRPNEYYQGLFGFVKGGRISNLTLSSFLISGQWFVGGLAAVIRSSSVISNVHSSGTFMAQHYAGALAGRNNNSLVTHCSSSGTVSADSFSGGLIGSNINSTIYESSSSANVIYYFCVGGLVGINTGSVIENCYATGNVAGNSSVGGLVGQNNDSSEIIGSYSTGEVTANMNAGGLVGSNFFGAHIIRSYSNSYVAGNNYTGGLVGDNFSATIDNCYATGNVTSSTSMAGNLGGLAGRNNYLIKNSYSTGIVSGNGYYVRGLMGRNTGTVTGSYWDMEASQQATSHGGEGRLTEQMTFPYADNTYVGWDFTEIWDADEDYTMNNGYPYLRDIAEPVSVKEEQYVSVPARLTLSNYPNPFNPETTISYSLPEDVENLELRIYNLRGQLIKTLISSHPHTRGDYQIAWDGRTDRGKSAPSGVYFYLLSTPDDTISRKMLLLK